MIAARVLDVILILLLIAYLSVGLRTGFSRMLGSLGHEVSAVGVAAMYQGLIDIMVVD